MAFDAGMLRLVVNEIGQLGDCKVEKVYQPSNDEIVLMLHSLKRNAKLLINAGSNCPRLNITEGQTEYPQKAAMLCMLLRKHLGSGRIVSITQPDFERLVEISFSSLNEMGDVITPKIIIELISASPKMNVFSQQTVILVNSLTNLNSP